MVKIKVLSRSSDDHLRGTATSLDPVYHNPDPALHPFERSREYVRALNATKLDRVFARPFLFALSGHRDGVYALRRHPTDIQFVASGSGDGEIRVWHMPTKETRWRVPSAHQGMVRSICYAREDKILSVGTDKLVKLWDPSGSFQTLSDTGSSYDYEVAAIRSAYANASSMYDERDPNQAPPQASWASEDILTALDHQRSSGGGLSHRFATGSSNQVLVWDYSRSEPVQKFEWGSGSITSMSFNPIETDILAASTQDRDVILYDVRGVTPIRKLSLAMRSNAIAWNPMEPFNVAVANEDSNCYTFDVRMFNSALCIHQDHVGPVISLDFSPTGREFVTGSYDRTLRLFDHNAKHSRDAYHTKRMQRIFSVQFSGDAKFVLSASDDTNIRVWKSLAAAAVGVLLPREKQQLDYKHKLMERYKNVPELRRIAHHKHIPKPILQAQRLKKVIRESQARKHRHSYTHSRPSQRQVLDKARKRVVVSEEV